MEALHDLSASLDESLAAPPSRYARRGRPVRGRDRDEADSEDEWDEEEDERNSGEGGAGGQEDGLFGEVRRHGHSGSAQQRQLYAILQAVSGVLDEQKQAPTPTAYFAVLMTALSSPHSLATAAPPPAAARGGRRKGSRAKQAAEADDDTPSVAAALLHLLHLVLPEVSTGVLQAKFGEINGVFTSILSTHFNQPSALRPLVQCMGVVLRVQEGGAWRQGGPALTLLQKLLALAVDTRPKIRQAAQTALSSIHSRPSPLPSSATTATHNFCTEAIRSFRADSDDHRVTLYTLRLLHAILPYLPSNSIGELAPLLLGLLGHNNALLNLHTLQTLQQAFEGAITFQDASTMLKELVEVQPSHTETEAAVEFAALLRAAMNKLHELDSPTCTRTLPTAVQLLTNYLACDNQEVVRASAQALKEILAACIDVNTLAFETSMQSIVSTLQAALAYSGSHQSVLEAIAVIAQKVMGGGAASLRILKPVIKSLDDLQTQGLETRPAEAAMSAAWCAIIRTLGPREVLSLVPLNLSESASGRPRPWLVAELRQGTRYAQLAFFFDEILPLAQELEQKGRDAQAQGKVKEAADFNLMATQLWGLLTSFCFLPTDLTVVFDKKAKMLGAALTDAGPETRRNIVCEALETLITQLLGYKQHLKRQETGEASEAAEAPKGKGKTENYEGCPLSMDETEAGIAVVAKYSRNFLPCLFNVFGSPVSPGLRQTVANTISVFLEITPSELVNTFFKNVIQKLLEAITSAATAPSSDAAAKEKEATAAVTRNLLVDLVVIFVRWLSHESLDFLWKIISGQLEKGTARDVRGEKRFYQVIREMCGRHPDWAAANAQSLHRLLTAGLARACASGKKARLRCVASLVKALPDRRYDLISEVTSAVAGEVMLCTKEANSKTREIAFSTLTLMADRMAGPAKDPMPFFKIAVAGLAGTTTHMISATIFSLSHLVHHFRAELAREDRNQLVGDLVGAIVLLLGMQARPVAKAALGFVKSALSSLPPASLQPHLPGIVQGIMGWLSTTDPQTQRFRAKVKILLERLIRRYGLEAVEAHVPQQHHPLLHAVKKTLQEKKKAKAKKPPGKMAIEGEEPELKAPKMSQNWILDSKDEPIDFTDPSHIQHITSRNPRERAAKKEEEEITFEAGPDGRMLIEDPDDEEEVKAKRKREQRGKKRQSSEMDEMAEEEEANGMAAAQTGKRKASRAAREEEEEEEEQEEEQRPQKAGGQGPAKRRRKEPASTHAGERFKAQKAGGDIKKGRVEPYAYLPLNPASLNKRTKRKAVGQWRGVVRAAQAGAKAASKGKKK